jgi:hypothetical protein
VSASAEITTRALAVSRYAESLTRNVTVDTLTAMTGHFRTVFELGLTTFPWLNIIMPLSLVVLGALFARFSTRQWYRGTGFAAIGLGSFFFLIISVSLVPDWFGTWSDYRGGRSATMTGIVENLRPPVLPGPTLESFSVQGRKFSYYVGHSTPCFTNSPLGKGPIRNGINVRLHFNGDCIQKVEIEE